MDFLGADDGIDAGLRRHRALGRRKGEIFPISEGLAGWLVYVRTNGGIIIIIEGLNRRIGPTMKRFIFCDGPTRRVERRQNARPNARWHIGIVLAKAFTSQTPTLAIEAAIVLSNGPHPVGRERTDPRVDFRNV